MNSELQKRMTGKGRDRKTCEPGAKVLKGGERVLCRSLARTFATVWVVEANDVDSKEVRLMRRKNTGFGRSNRKRIISVSLSPSFEFWRNWHSVFSALTAPNPHPVCHLALSFFFPIHLILLPVALVLGMLQYPFRPTPLPPDFLSLAFHATAKIRVPKHHFLATSVLILL